MQEDLATDDVMLLDTWDQVTDGPTNNFPLSAPCPYLQHGRDGAYLA